MASFHRKRVTLEIRQHLLHAMAHWPLCLSQFDHIARMPARSYAFSFPINVTNDINRSSMSTQNESFSFMPQNLSFPTELNRHLLYSCNIIIITFQIRRMITKNNNHHYFHCVFICTPFRLYSCARTSATIHPPPCHSPSLSLM